MSPKRLGFTVRFLSASGTVSEAVVLEAQSMTHRPVPAAAVGPLAISVTAHQERGLANPAAPLQPWTAYGSSVDNITGDAWYSKVQAEYPYNER